MPDLTTIAVSFAASVIGGVVVAFANDFLQRNREQLRTKREKGELIIAALKSLSELYIDKYNYAYQCGKDNSLHLSDKFGSESPLGQRMRSLENEIIYSSTLIHFPSFKPMLDEWTRTIASAEALLRSLASGNYSGDHYKSTDYISDVDTASWRLTEQIVRQIEIDSSVSLFGKVWERFRARLLPILTVAPWGRSDR